MSNRRTGPVAAKTESTAWGLMVAIRSRRLYLSASEAEELAHQLIVAAHCVRTEEARPATRPLPFSEGFALETVTAGDSAVTRDAGLFTGAGETISGGAS